MQRRVTTSRAATIGLCKTIEGEVTGWRNQGYHPLPTETTLQLLRHWFDEQGDADEKFHPCQRHAIETIIYLHEILGIKSIRQLYEKFEPSWLKISDDVKAEADIPFMKYCCKMATGSGKTWVLAALVIWQYFNAVNGEAAPSGLGYSPRFLIVAPGHEVLNRLLDSFKGPRDPKSHNRQPERSDYRRALFVPQDGHWKGRFNLLDHILEPGDLRANATAPDGPFVAVVNWQQFRMDDGKETLAEQYGLSLPELPQGEIIADYLTEFPDLIVMNDEAHHVHGKRSARAEELVWRKFMTVLSERMRERHGKDRGLFLQVDFSATPFYGSGDHRDYFPHIVYDYDLRQAMKDMLVKQLFLEERQNTDGKKKKTDLDFRATREDADKGKRGEAIKLANDQKMIIDIAVTKLNQLTHDLRKQFDRKPVLMILCEDTTVANMVHAHLVTACENYRGSIFSERQVLLFHSELKKETHGYTMEEARGAVKASGDHPTLAGIDDENDPLQIVVSVLALREGFDKNNICVTAVLRSAKADMLLEQIVGRGLRLMFPEYKYPGAVQDAKQQAFAALQRREKPENSLDFLYIVEHPRFRAFYEELRSDKYEIGGGDSSDTKPTGDLIPIDIDNSRVPQYDIAWPAVVQDESRMPSIQDIEITTLPSGTWDIDQLKATISTIAITDYYPETDTKANTWSLRDRFFDYNSFIAGTADMVAKEGRAHRLTGRRADIAALVDDYTRTRLFKREIDFDVPENYKVLAYRPVQDFVVEILRKIIADHIGQPKYEVRGLWRRLSELSRIQVREQACIKTRHCIYPKIGFSSRFGGLERDVMRELLDGSSEILAWCKLQRRHGLSVVYRDESGLQRTYEVDFVLRTAESCFLLETKSDDDLSSPTVGLKAQAAKTWCEQICGLPLPGGAGESWGEDEAIDQPLTWEYLLLSETLYHANRNVSFTALLSPMRALRDQVIAQQFHGALFVQ